MNPILERLGQLVDEGLHPHAVRVQYHPGGSAMAVTFGDWVDAREGVKGLPQAPPETKVTGWERYPDDWSRLPEALWEEVERWVHEAAWHSKASDWARNHRDAVLQEHELGGLYGPFWELGLEMQPRHLSWLFKPNAWLHPGLPEGIRKRWMAERATEIPWYGIKEPKPNEQFVHTLGHKSPSLGGEHDEGIWIPGARFEASIAANRTFATIRDRKHVRAFDSMDAGVLRNLVDITGYVNALMSGDEPEEFEPQDFRAAVSKDRSRADIAYVGGAKFVLLSHEDVKELNELSSVILENLEVGRP